MKRVILVSALVILGGFSLACGVGGTSASPSDDNPPSSGKTPTQDESSGPLTLTVGKSMKVESDGATATVTLVSAKSYDQDQTPGFPQEPQNGVFEVISVKAVSTKGQFPVNPFYFKLVGPSGQAYETTPATFDPQLNAVNLNAGQNTSGNVVFDVPKSAIAKGAKIEISDALDNPYGYWKL